MLNESFLFASLFWGTLGGGYLLGLTDTVSLRWIGAVTPLGAAGFWIAAIASVLCAGALVTGYFLIESARALRDREPRVRSVHAA
jgi:Na+-driven multidrug efflux pump